jgi:hypothetical protein
MALPELSLVASHTYTHRVACTRLGGRELKRMQPAARTP